MQVSACLKFLLLHVKHFKLALQPAADIRFYRLELFLNHSLYSRNQLGSNGLIGRSDQLVLGAKRNILFGGLVQLVLEGLFQCLAFLYDRVDLGSDFLIGPRLHVLAHLL